MTKAEMFAELWIKYDYCMTGHDYRTLYKSMKKAEVWERLKEERRHRCQPS